MKLLYNSLSHISIGQANIKACYYRSWEKSRSFTLRVTPGQSRHGRNRCRLWSAKPPAFVPHWAVVLVFIFLTEVGLWCSCAPYYTHLYSLLHVQGVIYHRSFTYHILTHPEAFTSGKWKFCHFHIFSCDASIDLLCQRCLHIIHI